MELEYLTLAIASVNSISHMPAVYFRSRILRLAHPQLANANISSMKDRRSRENAPCSYYLYKTAGRKGNPTGTMTTWLALVYMSGNGRRPT